MGRCPNEWMNELYRYRYKCNSSPNTDKTVILTTPVVSPWLLAFSPKFRTDIFLSCITPTYLFLTHSISSNNFLYPNLHISIVYLLLFLSCDIELNQVLSAFKLNVSASHTQKFRLLGISFLLIKMNYWITRCIHFLFMKFLACIGHIAVTCNAISLVLTK